MSLTKQKVSDCLNNISKRFTFISSIPSELFLNINCQNSKVCLKRLRDNYQLVWCVFINLLKVKIANQGYEQRSWTSFSKLEFGHWIQWTKGRFHKIKKRFIEFPLQGTDPPTHQPLIEKNNKKTSCFLGILAHLDNYYKPLPPTSIGTDWSHQPLKTPFPPSTNTTHCCHPPWWWWQWRMAFLGGCGWWWQWVG